MVSCEALEPLEVADVINEVHHLVEEMAWVGQHPRDPK
jgi:hypothetical protein